MNPRGPAVVWGVLAFVIGALPAFALAGRALFADGSATAHWEALGLYALSLLVIGFGGGALASARRLPIAIGLALPMLPVLALATWGPAQTYVLAAAFVLVAGACAWLGVSLGARLTEAVIARRKR